MSDDLKLFELYFQNDKEYYLNRLKMYRNGQRFTFNIFAFLFGLFWFTYRKMYVQALIILLAIIGESFIEELFLVNSVDPDADKMISIVVTIVIATITGFLGNNLYIKQAQKAINASKEKFKDNVQLENSIKRKGGVSYIPLVLLGLAIVSFFIYNNYLARNGG